MSAMVDCVPYVVCVLLPILLFRDLWGTLNTSVFFHLHTFKFYTLLAIAFAFEKDDKKYQSFIPC